MAKMINEDDCPKGLPGWLATFGDLMSLLLTFFVLLLSFSSTIVVNFNSAMGALQGALVGVVTDRDICMAALMTGLPLGLIRVREVMSTEIHTCNQDDELTAVHGAMREQQIRRMPVVNADSELVGVLSLNDLTNEAYSGRSKAAAKRQRDAGRTLAAVCEHHEVEVAEEDEPEEEE